MEIKAIKNKILAVLGIVILGAIGSGIWDWVLSDLFVWTGSSTIKLFSLISSTYIDNLYSEISMGASYLYLQEIHALTFSIYFLLPIIVFVSRVLNIKSDDDGDIKKNKNKNSKRKFNFAVTSLLVIVVFLLLQVWQTHHKVIVSLYFERSIEILSPYISSEEVKLLRSKYRQVNDEKTTHNLKARLEELANENKIILPTIEIL